MNKKTLSFIKITVSSSVALLLLYLVFRNVDLNEFLGRAKSISYLYVIISIALSIGAYVARAYRWNILLAPLGYELKTSRTTLAVLIGYLANLALPRLGEITRCGVLARNDRVLASHAFGTVIVERIVDVLTLLFLIAFSLLIESERLIQFLTTAYKDLSLPFWVLPIVLVLIVIGIIVTIFIVRNSRKKGRKNC